MLNKKWITKNQNTRLYQIPVPIVGLTGGIASGKSTVAELFRQHNISVIDADQLVKNIYKKNETVEFIKSNFPSVMENNKIIFSKLRELAFNNPAIKTKLEAFIYSHLPEEFIQVFKTLPPSPFIVYDVPLLFEKNLDQLIDVSICVFTPRSIQIERLINRDHITKDLAEKILDQQMNIEEKKAKADIIIENIKNKNDLVDNFNLKWISLVSP